MSLRDLPSVDQLLQAGKGASLVARFGRPLTLQAVRAGLERSRESIRAGGEVPSSADLLEQALQTLLSWIAPTLQPVINATGVIIHTNLGRAPLSRGARAAIEAVAAGYSNLEYDLKRGVRGQRETHCEGLLTQLTGAEAALVVNNNAGAVLLALTALAQGQEVIISRTQMIEIGGGFRIPDVLRQSGARLVEVGTTNRTHLRDFETALSSRTGLILRAHHSNFKILGFTTEPTLTELVQLAGTQGIPVLDDLGSGALLDTAAYGLGHEPMVQESLQAGANLVAFSGDKLLGGPQAGILVGNADALDRLRRHPLARALRADKLCLTALAATLTHYQLDEAEREIPLWQMIAAEPEILKGRAERWAESLGIGEVIQSRSTVGGGSLPEETLPTWALALQVEHPNAFTDRLRKAAPPIIARVERDRVLLDPRTVLGEQEEDLLEGLAQASSSQLDEAVSDAFTETRGKGDHEI